MILFNTIEDMEYSSYGLYISNNFDTGYYVFNNASFNQPVTIGNKITTCASMFAHCTSFNQPIIIPNSVIHCSHMFDYCTNFSNSIYFKTKNTSLDVTFLLSNCNNSKRKNIFFNSVLNSKFNNTAAYFSIVGRDSITWTPMTNGFYNTAFNIYCYYNYVP